jgi:hypothetical protein
MRAWAKASSNLSARKRRRNHVSAFIDRLYEGERALKDADGRREAIGDALSEPTRGTPAQARIVRG